MALVLVTLTGLFLTYRVLLSPLASLPGPRITAVTSLWLKYQEFRGERTVKLDLLHQIYGPVVRISPNEVSFNSYTALKEIYGMRSDFSKSDFYDLFVYYDERNTFTSLDRPNVRSSLVSFVLVCSNMLASAFGQEESGCRSLRQKLCDARSGREQDPDTCLQLSESSQENQRSHGCVYMATLLCT